jgi:hypothetical protein
VTNEQTPKNAWEVIPDFSQMWKSNNNYGYSISIEGIHASVSPHTERRSGCSHITYIAIIWTQDIAPQLRQTDFTSMSEAQAWCEPWVRHFYKFVQLQKQVECYRGWLDHYQEENDKLRTKLHEYELKEIRERFQTSLEQGGQA